MKQRVQQDRPEGGRANPAQRKAAQRQREIAGAQHQGHRHQIDQRLRARRLVQPGQRFATEYQFAHFALAPSSNAATSPMRHWYSVGLVKQKPFASRPKDSIAFAYGRAVKSPAG